MASIMKLTNSKGEISYRIRVYKGKKDGKLLKPYTMTYKPAAGMSDKQIQKELNRQAVIFEDKCKARLVTDNKQTFADYAEYVLKLKEMQGAKRSTLSGYRHLLKRINAGIGHLKIVDIRPQHLNLFYEQLSASGMRADGAKAQIKVDLKAKLAELNLTQQQLSDMAGIATNTLAQAISGALVAYATAEKIAGSLDASPRDLFLIVKNNKPLSSKTIAEHHRLISTILAQADKELLIPYNPAAKASPPKIERKEANYFGVETIDKIREALLNEPIKWRLIVHLLLITGARRGELGGLRWNDVDCKKKKIHIRQNLLYDPKIGLYVDSTKTLKSDRYISLPKETVDLILNYREWYLKSKLAYGNRWHDTDYLFFQEKSGNEGLPMHPDSINSYLRRFEKRHDLPHLNPHAFRHTHVSLLYFGGVDAVTISSRVGHSKVSTTTDIYAHLMRDADESASECVANAILRAQNHDNVSTG